jgi:YD repeat-containing protein
LLLDIYDATGNRTNTGYTTDAGNRITSDGTWSYAYDSAGNVVQKSQPGTVWSYSYDLENRLIAARHATTPTAAPVVTVTYGVDAFGNPVSRVSYDTNGGTVATRYYGLDGWDTAKPTPAGNENIDTWVEFVSPDHPYYVREWLYDPGFNDPVATFNNDGSQYYFYQADREGSIRVRTDMTGTPLATLTYDAFGQVVSGTLTDPFGFQGMYYDADSQTYQVRRRMYDPAIGRFYCARRPLTLCFERVCVVATGYSCGRTRRIVHSGPCPT